MLNESQKESIFALAERICGVCQKGPYRKEVLISNFQRLLTRSGLSCEEALKIVQDGKNTDFVAEVTSALTIHTTSWFRETPHFEKLKEYILNSPKALNLKILCAACSTGEEPYSLALTLEHLKLLKPDLRYTIDAFDIDPKVVARAKRGTYLASDISAIPEPYRNFVLLGKTAATKRYFALPKTIRDNIRFFVQSLVELPGSLGSTQYDFVFCRNALIYFDEATVSKIVSSLEKHLKSPGRLVLGHSESCDFKKLNLTNVGHSMFLKSKLSVVENELEKSRQVTRVEESTKVLVIDDSRTYAAFLNRTLNELGAQCTLALNLSEAETLLRKDNFDLITLDLNLPDGNGFEWLQKKRDSGLRTPVVVISETKLENAHELLGALETNAQDYVPKEYFSRNPKEYGQTVLAISRAHRTKPAHKPSVGLKKGDPLSFHPDLILIVASTGGPQAFNYILSDIPKPCPPILVVQHITPLFAEAFAKRLAELSHLNLGSVNENSSLAPNTIYASLEAKHLFLFADKDGVKVRYDDGPARCGHKPAGDVLFSSAAALKDLKILAILMTGMGADGAAGMKTLKDKLGSRVLSIGESESSCIVYGMPREAKLLGAIDLELSLEGIRSHLHQIGENFLKKAS